MKILFRILAAMLFILFFGFALKNTQEAALRFFFNYEIRGPLVMLLLAFFTAGAVLGILAMLPTVVRHRRELGRHKKAIVGFEQEKAQQIKARTLPPQPDSVVNR
jgi:uncharacterized integral membrane protein